MGKKQKGAGETKKIIKYKKKLLKVQYLCEPYYQIYQVLQITLQGNSVKNKYDDCQNKCKNCESTHNKKCKVQKTYVQKLKN